MSVVKTDYRKHRRHVMNKDGNERQVKDTVAKLYLHNPELVAPL